MERICKNYKLCDSLADGTDECPIKYSYLLYEIFSYMRDWILAIEELPLNQPNIILKSTSWRLDENDNIIKSSILALCRSTYFVLISENIGERLKYAVGNMIFEIYFELRCSGNYDRYASILLDALTENNKYRRDNATYRNALADIFTKEEMEYHITHNEVHIQEIKAALT